LPRYTILDDPEADAAVQGVLDRVTGEVAALLGRELQAIVLAGGYGRGEGGAYRAGGAYRLVNDLDVLVFVQGSLRQARARYGAPLERLSHRLLAHGRGLKEIDLVLASAWQYRFLVPNTVGYYEIAHGHQTVYGDLDLARTMPGRDPARLPLYEGTNYFRNRGSGLLIAALYWLNDGLGSAERRQNYQIELQKACQAMGDACLLVAGQYHFSYRERRDRFRRLSAGAFGIPPELFDRVARLYEPAVDQKLVPHFEWPGDGEMVERWFEVRDTFGAFFAWYEAARLGRTFAGWGDYANEVARRGAGEPLDLRLRSALASLLALLRGRTNATSPIARTRRCLSTLPLLLFSLSHNGQIEPSLVGRAAALMGRADAVPALALWQALVAEHLLISCPTVVVMDALARWQKVG
jgi:hypothetical protein